RAGRDQREMPLFTIRYGPRRGVKDIRPPASEEVSSPLAGLSCRAEGGYDSRTEPGAAPRGEITAHERMSQDKFRQAIAFEAARLMYERIESEYFTAKRKAAKRLCRRGVKPEDLPSNAEIREQIQVFARIHEGDRRTQHLRAMRLEA